VLHGQLCEPVKKLPKCRYFRDITWTLVSGADNITEQIVHCHCPRGAVAYLIKRQVAQAPHGLLAYRYSFACSPQSVSSLPSHLFLASCLRVRGMWGKKWVTVRSNLLHCNLPVRYSVVSIMHFYMSICLTQLTQTPSCVAISECELAQTHGAFTNERPGIINGCVQ
jgi:hypothetical protein